MNKERKPTMRTAASMAVCAAALVMLAATPASAGNSGDIVQVTPLGSNPGEFCARDRAILFEDPNGTTLLFDPGRTVRGSGDPRLPAGGPDVVLLSSVHSDHIGDVIVDGGPCGNPTIVASTTPVSNTAEIIAGTGALNYAGGEMRDFLRSQVAAAGGLAAQVDVLRFGGSRNVNGVEIAIVTAIHSNGIGRAFLDPSLSGPLAANNLTAYTGPDNGFVITFTNGLVVYLSADTGHTSDMKTIVNGYYGPQLAVVNMGDIFSMGPREAAWAVNELIQPKSVIPSHANEAATSGGEAVPGSRTAQFVDLVDPSIDVHLPLSGVAMSFDSKGRCVAGC